MKVQPGDEVVCSWHSRGPQSTAWAYGIVVRVDKKDKRWPFMSNKVLIRLYFRNQEGKFPASFNHPNECAFYAEDCLWFNDVRFV